MGIHNSKRLLRFLLQSGASEAVLDDGRQSLRDLDRTEPLSVARKISILALSCTVATLNPRFRKPTLRPYRAAMYSGLGLSAIIFITHGIANFGWTIQSQRMSLGWMGLMAAFNLIGASVYAARVDSPSENEDRAQY